MRGAPTREDISPTEAASTDASPCFTAAGEVLLAIEECILP